MGIDASIALQGKLPQFDNPLSSLAQVSAIQNAQQQNRLADLAYGEKQREVDQNRLLGEQYKSALLPDGTMDRNKLYTGLAGAGLGAKLPGIQKGFADQDKAAVDATKAKLEAGLKHFEVVGQIMAGVKDQASYDAARQQTAQIFGSEAAAKLPAQYDPAVIAQNQQQALSVKDQLEQQWKALHFGLDQAKAGEVVRHNTATEATASGQLGVSKGLLGVAQGNLGVNQSREVREATAPKGQIVQGEQGTMLVDQRTGQGKPVMVDGQPMAPKLKDLPAPMQKTLIENGTALRKIDNALAAIDAYPQGLGSKNVLGDSIRQRTDPDGVNVRALVADIGSLKLHDRSGAAVTAAETPRLAPFIPQATDSPETARKKLTLFKQEYQSIQDDILNTYGREQGYKAPGGTAPAQRVAEAVKSGEVTKLANARPAQVKTAADYAKLPSGAVYTAPDGSMRTKS